MGKNKMKKGASNTNENFFKKPKSDEKSRNNQKKYGGFKRSFDKMKSLKTDSFFVQKSNAKPSKNSQLENSFSIEKKSSEDKVSKSGNSFTKEKKKFGNSKTKAEAKGNKNKLNKVKDGKVEKPNKKAFDKKRWRLQKYSKKYKLEQWEEKRKKIILREYYKQIKDEKPKLDVKQLYEKYEEEEEVPSKSMEEKIIPSELDEEGIEYTEVIETPERAATAKTGEKPKKKIKLSSRKKAQMEIERLKQEKQAKREELARQKEERKEALKIYKKKKVEKLKKLNQKTKKGQPIMKGRIEMLLEKIQSA